MKALNYSSPKIIGTVYTVVVILSSFTFFGVQSDKPAADLRFRITENEKLYGELRQEVEDVVRQEVADKLYFRFYHALPRDYRIDIARGDDGPEPPDGWPPKPHQDLTGAALATMGAAAEVQSFTTCSTTLGRMNLTTGRQSDSRQGRSRQHRGASAPAGWAEPSRLYAVTGRTFRRSP